MCKPKMYMYVIKNNISGMFHGFINVKMLVG